MDDKQLLIKQFRHFNIEIYGTHEEPLFKANDIGNLLGIKKIRTTLDNLDEECKVLKEAHTMGGLQEQLFLTEEGLYELLFISRKPIAKEFKKWVRSLIKDIRINSNKQLHENNQQLQKQLEYYKEKTFEQTPLDQTIYVMSTDKDNVFKIGKTNQHTKSRKSQLQTACVEDINILYEFKTSNSKLLEELVHYSLHKYRSHSGREHFFCNLDFIKMTINICGKFINTIGSIYQSISKQELIQKLEINIPTDIILQKKTKHKKYSSHTQLHSSDNSYNDNDNDDSLDELIDELLQHPTPLIQEISTTYF
jgi:prophage antirepressor-like protein